MTIDTQRLATDPDYWRECGAPEDAEFYGPEIKDWAECWYKKDPDWSAYLGGGWNEFGYDEELLDAFFQQRLSTLISRPKTASEEWVDGLPPVNWYGEFLTSSWRKGTVACYVIGRHGKQGIVQFDDDWATFFPKDVADRVRPIRTKQERQRDELAEIVSAGFTKCGIVPDPGDCQIVAVEILSRCTMEPKP